MNITVEAPNGKEVEVEFHIEKGLPMNTVSPPEPDELIVESMMEDGADVSNKRWDAMMGTVTEACWEAIECHS